LELLADATVLKAAIHGDLVPRAPDTWLEVKGGWRQRSSSEAAATQTSHPS
jgi:uncharacterized membrane protein YcgQ (UPF0703/DUF1980 family)